jgi:hypothetical protein
LQGDLMAIKKSNFACVYMRNISQYDSGERCGPWASCSMFLSCDFNYYFQILHRLIIPVNVYLFSSGRAKIANFQFAVHSSLESPSEHVSNNCFSIFYLVMQNLTCIDWPELKGQCIFIICLSIHLSVRLLQFHLLLQNNWASFNKTWYKSFLGVGDAVLMTTICRLKLVN